MVHVAIAGGAGGLGRHIVEAILSTKKHTVVVLSRSSSNPELEALGAQIATVNYGDHASLLTALKGVHTVISAILSFDDQLITSQLALLHAAVEAGVKRFAPSEFAVAARPDDTMLIYQLKYTVEEAVAKSGLEWTIFENGILTNYLASGTKGIGYLQSHSVVVDVQNGKAEVPGTGDEKIVLTRVEDVGAFVAASLDLNKWPERSAMAGDSKSFNEVIALAETVRGRKFDVTYIPVEDLLKQSTSESSSPRQVFLAEIMIEWTRGRFYYDANLNRLCPTVKPVSVEEFLKLWWS